MNLSRSYAQFDTDIVLASYFQEGEQLHGIEVGAVDGIFISNTYALEKEKGAEILCIEANPKYEEALRRNRKHVISCAVASFNGDDMPFYVISMDDMRNLSSVSALEIDQELLANHKAAYRISEYEEKVKVRTLDSCIADWNPPKIDFVSIDIEGGELEGMRGFDVNKWKPRVILLEANSQKHVDELTEYMSRHNYKVDRKVEVNLFFTRTDGQAPYINPERQ